MAAILPLVIQNAKGILSCRINPVGDNERVNKTLSLGSLVLSFGCTLYWLVILLQHEFKSPLGYINLASLLICGLMGIYVQGRNSFGKPIDWISPVMALGLISLLAIGNPVDSPSFTKLAGMCSFFLVIQTLLSLHMIENRKRVKEI